MDQHEFTALQVTVLVRTQRGGGPAVKETFDSLTFQYKVQDAVGKLMKETLQEAEVDLDEVIISIDAPAEKAERVQKKGSLVSRLLGKN